MTRRITTEVTICSEKIHQPLDLAVVSDLHNGEYFSVLPVLRNCDGILIVGDLVDRHDKQGGFSQAIGFLSEAPKCAPTFYAMGNHERRLPQREAYLPYVEKSDVVVLEDQWVAFQGIVLGGMANRPKRERNNQIAVRMGGEPGFRLLMCHHPEDYEPFVKGHGIDLTIAGHAHGGQVQLFRQGMYAPGQGLLPRFTHGFYDDEHLLVSRGMTNATWAPRLFNPCELIVLHLRGEKDA